jgi:anti-anti-sigma regulatory factor
METSVQVVQGKDFDKVVIVGPINEEAEVHLSKLNDTLAKTVVINFRQVSYINSLGVRAWINFMRDVSGRKLIFEECTPEIVNQINMIPNFKGNAEIKSVYGTFFCNSCNNTQEEIFEAGKSFPNPPEFSVNIPKCKTCNSADVEFEEVEDSFFAFLLP